MSRVLLVHPDVKWCHYWMARDIQRYAPPGVSVVVVGQSEYEAVVRHAGPLGFAYERGEDIDGPHALDAVFHFSLSGAPSLSRVVARRRGALVGSEAWLYPERVPGDYRTNGWTSERNSVVGKDLASRLDFIISPTERIGRVVEGWSRRLYTLPQGVDMELWSPGNKRRTDFLRVLWCGDTTGVASLKGADTVLASLTERLTDEHGVRWDVNARTYANALPRSAMRDWYRRGDVLVCTSVSEGGPYPPLEMVACGGCVASTPVGMLGEWPELRAEGLLVDGYHDAEGARRAVARLAEKLVQLRDDPEGREAKVFRLRASLLDRYSWRKLAPKWLAAMLGDA